MKAVDIGLRMERMECTTSSCQPVIGQPKGVFEPHKKQVTAAS